MVESGDLELWSDTEIMPGQDWKSAIEASLQSAKAAILLISPNYLASNFIQTVEFPDLLKAAHERDLKLISVILSPTLFDFSHLANHQPINSASMPLNDLSSPEQESVLKKLVQFVQENIDQETRKSESDIVEDPHERALRKAMTAVGGNSNLVSGNIFSQAENTLEKLKQHGR